MNIFTDQLEKKIHKIVINPIIEKEYGIAANAISIILDDLYANIPDEKRFSYGRYYTIKVLAQNLYEKLSELQLPIFEISATMIEKPKDFRLPGVCLGLLSHYGYEDEKHLHEIMHLFKEAAVHDHWETRENAAGFFHKLIKNYKQQMKPYMEEFVQSSDPKLRRFVSESLRPVAENRWLQKQPEFSLSILKYLFKESSAYPRTSVGNNLSDLARGNPDLIYHVVKDLVDSGDKNSYWIAYRACRNLVKKEPLKVMDLLQVDEYKYKQRIHKRSDYQRS